MYLYFFVYLYISSKYTGWHGWARDASGGRLMRCAGVYMDNDVANGDDDDVDDCDIDGCDCDDDEDYKL